MTVGSDSGGKGLGEGMGKGLGEGMGKGLGEGMGKGLGVLEADGPATTPGVTSLMRLGPGRTGGGMPSGNGFIDGYGVIPRSSYATPADLDIKPWALEFYSPDGEPGFPHNCRFDPTADNLQWTTDDWDPGLRFWTLPFDPHLTEWLQDVDMASPAVMCAREFAQQHAKWQTEATDSVHAQLVQLTRRRWLDAKDTEWWLSDAPAVPETSKEAAEKEAAEKEAREQAAREQTGKAWIAIQRDLDALVAQMEDSRSRYLAEALAQADGLPRYFIHFLGIDAPSKPWTVQLMRCGVAIGNLLYMYYKARFRRVRPSVLCPGLVPPFGPPRHPAFPSGHSTLCHFIALLLLEIEPIAKRYGTGMGPDGKAGKQAEESFLVKGPGAISQGPLLWLARRMAETRERIGVHYPTDTNAGRTLANGVWNAIFHGASLGGGAESIEIPTLQRVLKRAEAEWL